MNAKARAEKKKTCENCGTRFGLTTHKHSCKRCGAIICSDCSKQKLQILLYQDKKPHKICLNCSDDHNHNTNLKVTGKLQWNTNSNIMRQWLKNINASDHDSLQSKYSIALEKAKDSALTKTSQFQEYLTFVDRIITSDNGMRHFSQSFLEMLHSVWGVDPDIPRIRESLSNLIKAFFADFPDQESELSFKEEYIDVGAFLLMFGTECSAWRIMKEIYGIIIPMESISHITNNDFTYGEKHLLNFLLDKIRYPMDSIECSNVYAFIVDRGIEFINSFLVNHTNFSTSYQIFNLVINMPYNRRWSELLRSFGVFIIVNQDMFVSGYEKILWEEMRLSLLIATKWKKMKEMMDVHCLFSVADPRQMSRFSMIEDSESDSNDTSTNEVVFVDDVIEENKMLKQEVLQIFKVKQIIVTRMNEIEQLRMELQKRELVKDQLEAKSKECAEANANLTKISQQYIILKQAYANLQEKVAKTENMMGVNRTHSLQQAIGESTRQELLAFLSSEGEGNLSGSSGGTTNSSSGSDILEKEEQIRTLRAKVDQLTIQVASQGDQILKQSSEMIKQTDEIEQLRKQLADGQEGAWKQQEVTLRNEIAGLKEKVEQLTVYNQMLQQEKMTLFLERKQLQIGKVDIYNNIGGGGGSGGGVGGLVVEQMLNIVNITHPSVQDDQQGITQQQQQQLSQQQQQQQQQRKGVERSTPPESNQVQQISIESVNIKPHEQHEEEEQGGDSGRVLKA